MTNLNVELALTLLIRSANAVLWSVFVIQVVREDRSLIRLARLMVLPVILVGMWMLVIGSLAAIGIIPGAVARTLYTLFTAAAALVALALVTSPTTEK